MADMGSRRPSEVDPMSARRVSKGGSFVSLGFLGDTYGRSIKDDHLSDSGSDSITRLPSGLEPCKDFDNPTGLDRWDAAALCSATSAASAFYAVSFCIDQAGIYAPIAFVLSSVTTYCLKSIIGGMICAVPANGGSYNILSFLSSPRSAIFTGSITLLYHFSLLVLTARYAVDSIRFFFEDIVDVPPLPAVLITVTVLSLVALLSHKYHTRAAFFLTTFHIVVLVFLVVASIVAVVKGISAPDGSLVVEYNLLGRFEPENHPLNLVSALPPPPPAGPAGRSVFSAPRWIPALFFGFHAAFLGSVGTTDAADLVEMHGSAGAAKRCMSVVWAVSSVTNVVLACLALCMLTLPEIEAEANGDGSILFAMAAKTGLGSWLQKWVAFDAILIFCMSAIVGFVNLSALLSRLSADSRLPAFLNSPNRLTSRHWIVFVTWFVACSLSIYFYTLETHLNLLQFAVAASLLSFTCYALAEARLKTSGGEIQVPVKTAHLPWIFILALIGLLIAALVACFMRSNWQLVGCILVFIALVVASVVATLYGNGKITSCWRPVMSRAEINHHIDLASRRNTMTFVPSPRDSKDSFSDRSDTVSPPMSPTARSD
eukprot:gene10126-15564_t